MLKSYVYRERMAESFFTRAYRECRIKRRAIYPETDWDKMLPRRSWKLTSYMVVDLGKRPLFEQLRLVDDNIVGNSGRPVNREAIVS